MRKFLAPILTAACVCAGLAAAAPAMAAPLYPDLTTLPPRDLRFDRADVSQDLHGDFHNVLRFTNTVWNNGAGRLELRATINPTTKDGTAYQRIYDDQGGYTDQVAGRFYWHAVHAHYHYDDWGRYQLWTKADYDAWVASGRTNGAPDEIGTKTTSCIMDEEFIKTMPNMPYPGMFPSDGCFPNAQNFMIQGLSPGWGDTYDYYRFEQWIDLGASGTLADGDYVLRSVTDPTNKIFESPNKADDSKEGPVANEGITQFSVVGGKIVDGAKPTGTIRINDIATSTKSASVTVKVLGRDDVSGVKSFRVSNNGTTFTAAKSYTGSGSTAQALSWDLTDPAYGGTSADGLKTVYVQFQDAAGKWSDTVTDTITLNRNNTGGGPATAYTNAVMADGPAGFWRLDDSGSTAADFTGAFPGTYVNGPALGTPGLLSSESDTAARFDGVNDYMSVGNAAALNPAAQVSVEAWIRPGSIPAAGTFASVVSKPEAYSLQFNGPRLEFTVMKGGGSRYRTQAPAGAIVANQTYHVVGTYDGANTHLYVNGTDVASMALTGAVGSSTSPLSVASWSGTNERFTGTIDEVAVYAKALSAARVQAHRAAGTTTSTTVTAPNDTLATATSSTSADVTWTDNSNNETDFEIQRDTNPSFLSPVGTTAPANATKVSWTGLNPSTTYYFRVRARNGSTNSAWSGLGQTTTFAAVDAPSGLTATAVSSSQINLGWTDNSSNETRFVIKRDTSPTFSSPVTQTVPAGTTTFQDTGLPSSTTFYYAVVAQNATDSSGASGTASATTQAGPASSYANEVATDAPVSWWRLGETSGTTAADQRSANTGAYVNGPVLGSASLLGSDTANRAVTFDGTNDQVRVPASASLNLASPFTLEAWIKPSKLPAAGQFASVLTKAESYSIQFNGPRLEFTIMQFGVRQRLQAPAGAVVAGQTYHVVATFDGTTRRLYLNGTEVANATLSGGASSSANNLYLGSWSGSSEFFAGTIDEAAVYSKALGAARVLAHYNAGH